MTDFDTPPAVVLCEYRHNLVAALRRSGLSAHESILVVRRAQIVVQHAAELELPHNRVAADLIEMERGSQ